MGVGIVMTAVGVLSLIAGSVVVATSRERIDIYCDGPVLCARIDDPTIRNVGVAMMAINGLAIAPPGIALWIIGGRKVPVRKKNPEQQAAPSAATLSTPELRVGATSVSLAFRY
jgi:hypothetical protein